MYIVSLNSFVLISSEIFTVSGQILPGSWKQQLYGGEGLQMYFWVCVSKVI